MGLCLYVCMHVYMYSVCVCVCVAYVFVLVYMYMCVCICVCVCVCVCAAYRRMLQIILFARNITKRSALLLALILTLNMNLIPPHNFSIQPSP